jgi:hypothetical protein
MTSHESPVTNYQSRITSFRACVLLAVLALAPAGGIAAEDVASVLGSKIARMEVEAAGDEPARAAYVRDWVWGRVYGHYLAEEGLSATPVDIAELLAYHREFERRDRLQRSRKLEELNGRLAGSDLDADERARLEEFRRVLIRMAEREAGSEHAPPEAGEQARFYGPWIEFWKANAALFRKYGGSVAATRAGPVAHGARVLLIADYERRGLVQFLDPRLREQVFELMSRPPGAIVPQDRVDFTPYWKLPIPPSYFPE